MKKAILSLLLALPFCASAQFKLQHSPVELPMSYRISSHKTVLPTPVENGTAAKGAAVLSRSYNHAVALGSYNNVNIYDTTLTSYILMWQDSAVRYTGASSGFGISWLSAAETFSPNTTLYNANTTYNRGKMAIDNNKSYTVDSVSIRGVYARGYNTYNDTLILSFVADSTAGNFIFLSFSGNTAANHITDSAAAVLWRGDDYLTRPITQISYNYNSGAKALSGRKIIKVPLTSATYADSLADGTHLIRVPVGITVPGTWASPKIAMSITFKSGTTYTAGSPVTNYNFFELMSHETVQDGFVQYPATDQNMSYLVSKDSSKTVISPGTTSPNLNYYVPTIAYNGTGNANLNSEVHDITWRATCNNCSKVNVADVENVAIGNAYPNPARATVNVPFSVHQATNVTVSLSNLLGQVLKTQSFNMGAGQGRTAVFNTSDLANGIYIYTVESEGNRQADRVLIAH